MRRGLALTELLVVMMLVGMLMAVALPRAGRTLDGMLARHDAERIALGHGRARALALATGTVARLLVAADSLVVFTGDTLRWRLPGPGLSGSRLENGQAETSYAPNGLSIGAANARYVVRRGAAAVEVLVSRLGRVRLVRVS